MSDPTAGECESHCVDIRELCHLPNGEAMDKAVEDLRSGYPVAIGRYPGLGWFVIESGGQGPYFVYREWSDGSNKGKEEQRVGGPEGAPGPALGG
jgi:hypothetical protein